MTPIVVANAIGLAGAALIVIAYLLLQSGRLESRSLSYSIVNGLGACGIIYSLFFEFNLSAFVIESFWLAISLYGVFRTLGHRNRTSHAVADPRDALKTDLPDGSEH